MVVRFFPLRMRSTPSPICCRKQTEPLTSPLTLGNKNVIVLCVCVCERAGSFLKSLYDEKVCSACIYVYVVRQSFPPILLSSSLLYLLRNTLVSPLNQSVRKKKKKNQIKNKENRELGGPPVNPLN